MLPLARLPLPQLLLRLRLQMPLRRRLLPHRLAIRPDMISVALM